jgi:putative FmdB family regulatory protein
MPTYEYVCRSCGHLFEIVQSMRDDPLRECPECGGELRKVFAPPAISFKGSGFYATDHGKKSTKKPAADKGEKAGKGDGGSTKDGTGTTTASKEGSPSGASTSSGSSASSGGSKEGDAS